MNSLSEDVAVLDEMIFRITAMHRRMVKEMDMDSDKQIVVYKARIAEVIAAIMDGMTQEIDLWNDDGSEEDAEVKENDQ